METTIYSEHITYETGCPKLAIVKFLGSYFSMETTIYSEHITYDIVKKKTSVLPSDLARIFKTGCPNWNFKNLGCPKSMIEKVKIITLIMYMNR